MSCEEAQVNRLPGSVSPRPRSRDCSDRAKSAKPGRKERMGHASTHNNRTQQLMSHEQRVQASKAKASAGHDAAGTPAFWAPTNKATRFLADFPGHEKAFLERSGSTGSSVSQSARDEAARKLSQRNDRQPGEIFMPKGKRVFAVPDSACTQTVHFDDGSSEQRVLVPVQPAKNDPNPSMHTARVALASNPDTEPVAGLPFHQRYSYYKRYGFAGHGAKSSFGYSPSKRPPDLAFYQQVYSARV